MCRMLLRGGRYMFSRCVTCFCDVLQVVEMCCMLRWCVVRCWDVLYVDGLHGMIWNCFECYWVILYILEFLLLVSAVWYCVLSNIVGVLLHTVGLFCMMLYYVTYFWIFFSWCLVTVLVIGWVSLHDFWLVCILSRSSNRYCLMFGSYIAWCWVYAKWCWFMLHDVRLSCMMLGYVTLCWIMLHDVGLCCMMLGYAAWFVVKFNISGLCCILLGSFVCFWVVLLDA